MTTQPLFPVPPPAPLRRSRALATKHRAGGRPRYAGYRPVRRVQCDECVLVVHEAQGIGAATIGTARHTRTDGVGQLRLCHQHEQAWRTQDEAAGLVGRSRRAVSRR
jgi:hypothetical protein